MTHRTWLRAALCVVLCAASSTAQGDGVPDVPEIDEAPLKVFRVLNADEADAVRAEQREASHASLDLGWRHHGLSFGNSAVWHGVRLNWRDEAVRELRGLNLTLWKPGPNVDGDVAALSLGLWGPRADTLDGVSLGLFLVQARVAVRGLWVAGLRVTSRELTGVGISPGMQIARGPATGLFASLAGNAAVIERGGPKGGDWGDDQLRGVALAGGANSHAGGVRGAQIAACWNGVGGPLVGLQLTGLTSINRGDVTGLSATGLIAGNFARVRGLAIGGALLHCDRLAGVSASALVNLGREVRGLQLGLWNEIVELQGISVGGFNRVLGAENGYLIGVLNYVPENTPWLRWLPVFNTRFGAGRAAETRAELTPPPAAADSNASDADA